MELRGAGLTLRPPVDADAPYVSAAVLASLDELAPWMPWATTNYSADEALKWIRGETGDLHRFVMVADVDVDVDVDADADVDVDVFGGIVGSCGLNHVDQLNSSANLGYWVRSDRAGEGFATAATRLLARFGLETVQFQRLEVVMSTRNGASRRVAEKAGATYEGTARRRLVLEGDVHDAQLWSFVRGDQIAQ